MREKQTMGKSCTLQLLLKHGVVLRPQSRFALNHDLRDDALHFI